MSINHYKDWKSLFFNGLVSKVTGYFVFSISINKFWLAKSLIKDSDFIYPKDTFFL